VLFTEGRERGAVQRDPVRPGSSAGPKAPCQQAIGEFQGFISRYPQSSRRVEAEFNIAQCREELDQLEQAYTDYLALLSRYPNPDIIKVKLGRIAERRSQKAPHSDAAVAPRKRHHGRSDGKSG
jgi:tetratricopeptide (TPR) repeat protein